MLRMLALVVVCSTPLISWSQVPEQAQFERDLLDGFAHKVIQTFDNGKRPEIRQWMKNKTKHKFTPEKAKREDIKLLVDDLYKAGAWKIYPDAHGDVVATSLLVVIGGDPVVRDKVEKRVAAFYAAHKIEPKKVDDTPPESPEKGTSKNPLVIVELK